jgi:hypothetical protein
MKRPKDSEEKISGALKQLEAEVREICAGIGRE